ncbi:MAG: L,D-transpeptidase family protein [Gammaproteobacteria bacterium]
MEPFIAFPKSLEISIADQSLLVYEGASKLRSYAISSALLGLGEIKNSYQTPRGRHKIRAKIGASVPVNTVFVGRRPSGEIWNPELAMAHPDRDWILTRILWLSGLERGLNRLGEVDTMQRYVYIHGSPDTVPMGIPGSKGCIRMRNSDIIELFDLVPIGTELKIQ